jgi:hypothetical protein
MEQKVFLYEEREALMTTAIEFLERDLEMSSRIQDFGRGYLYHYVRQQGQILISQHRLYAFYRQRFPEQVARRREGNFKHRTNFTVPGPNFLWCIDGYEKLKKFGFQVYAAVDAYSRYIIWIYIGRSATIAISVLK